MLPAASEKRIDAVRGARVIATLAVCTLTLLPGWRAGEAGTQDVAGFALASAALPGTAQAGQSTGAPTSQSAARFVVVIDAAHGGEDSGAQLADAVAEKTVTLAMSVRLRSLLTARGFQVITTREGNVKLDPDARAQIANRAGAAACLSLHATQTGTGIHIFVSSLAPSAPTRFLAWKTAQSAYVSQSLQLASVVNSALERGSDAGPIAANLARTSLPGVDSMACPAVTLEVAPVRGADGTIETEVTDADYQTRIVDALAAALLQWRTFGETGSPHAGGQPGANGLAGSTGKPDSSAGGKPSSPSAKTTEGPKQP